MAGKGTYGAYRAINPVGAEISQNIQQAERMGFHYRAEDQRKKENRQRRLELLAKEMGTDLSELKFDESGIKSVDAPLYQYFSKTKGEVAELYKKIEENPDDYESRILLEKKMNSAKTLAGFTQRYAEWQTNYKKIKEEGRDSQYLNKGIPEKINANLLNGQYKVINDKNGELQLFVDLDGDGEVDQDFASINVQEFLMGNPLYNIKTKTTMEDVVVGLSDNYGTAEVKTETGDITTRVKGFDPQNEEALMQDINKEMGATVDQMTDQAKSVLADDLGIDPKTIDTEEKFNDFKNRVANSVKGRVDRIYEETTDQTAETARDRLQLAREKFNYEKTQDALDREDKDKDKEGKPGDINVVTSEDGGYTDETGAVNFSIRNGVKVGNETVYGYSVKDGEITLTGQKPGLDNMFNKTDVPLNVSDDAEMAKFVVKLPNPETDKKFKNLAEFKEFSRKIEDKYRKEKLGLGDPNKLPDVEL